MDILSLGKSTDRYKVNLHISASDFIQQFQPSQVVQDVVAHQFSWDEHRVLLCYIKFFGVSRYWLPESSVWVWNLSPQKKPTKTRPGAEIWQTKRRVGRDIHSVYEAISWRFSWIYKNPNKNDDLNGLEWCFTHQKIRSWWLKSG